MWSFEHEPDRTRLSERYTLTSDTPSECAAKLASAEADIGGARSAGLAGVWLDRGRPWPLAGFQPDHTAGGFPGAVRIVLAAGG